MTKKISILIVDDNEDFSTLIKMYLDKTEDLEVIATAKDGFEALDKISAHLPALILLDLIMPNLDGIGVLERLQQLDLANPPIVIILSALGQDNIIRKAMALGVEYYFVKPLELSQLTQRIREIFLEKNSLDSHGKSERLSASTSDKVIISSIDNFDLKKNEERMMELEVTALLCEAGVPPHMLGYRYLREAILLNLKKEKPFHTITKELYPAIAQLFSTTPQKVERGIRNCIEKAWQRSNHDTMDSLLGYTMTYAKSKPTNSEFIAMITEKVKVMQKKG